jgi:hypothetical protein
LYQNSGKRLREILKDVYEFKNEEVKPTKSTGTCSIDHKLLVMKLFIDKRGVLFITQLKMSLQTQ